MFPLVHNEYSKEVSITKKIVPDNGYNNDMIDTMIQKHNYNIL